MIWWTSLAPWEFQFPFPGSLTCTLQVGVFYLIGRSNRIYYHPLTKFTMPYLGDYYDGGWDAEEMHGQGIKVRPLLPRAAAS